MEALLRTLIEERRRGEKVEWIPEKKPSAQRNLFGPVDHEQLQQDFQDMMQSSIERAQQKWNFNFVQNTPIEGLVQWEELESHQVPAFYHSCVVGDTQRPLQRLKRPLDWEDKIQHFAQMTLTEKSKSSKKTGGKGSPEGKKQRETSLTDDYSEKKRVKTNVQATANKSTP